MASQSDIYTYIWIVVGIMPALYTGVVYFAVRKVRLLVALRRLAVLIAPVLVLWIATSLACVYVLGYAATIDGWDSPAKALFTAPAYLANYVLWWPFIWLEYPKCIDCDYSGIHAPELSRLVLGYATLLTIGLLVLGTVHFLRRLLRRPPAPARVSE